jgi:hypothetical protein
MNENEDNIKSGKSSHVHELEELRLLDYPYYLKQFIDSTQSSPK